MTAILELDETTAPAPTRRRPPWPWLVAVLVAGLLGGLVASIAADHAEPSGPSTREVVLVVEGDGRASYAALVTGGRVEPIASTVAHMVTAPATVVLAIIATGRATCRVVVDGTTVVEEIADHGPATCVVALD